MIKKETAEKLAQTLKLDPEKFNEALTSEEEVDLEIPAVKVFTDAELQERDTNLITPIKTKHYNEGKEAGIEIEVKRLREELGLDFEGKTVTNLVEAVKTKTLAEAKIDPDKRVESLQKDKDLLQQTIDKLKGDHQNEIAALNGKLTEHQLNGQIEAAIKTGFPEGLSKADVRMMFNNSYEVTTEDGRTVVKRNGEVLKDDKQNARTIESVMEDFFAERGWDKTPPPPGGRKTGNEFGADGGVIAEFKRIDSASALDSFCKKHNLQPQSDEILGMMEKHMTPEQRNKALRE